MCPLRRRRGGGGARKPDAVALTPITRHSVGSFRGRGSVAPGSLLGQSGRGPRGTAGNRTRSCFGELLRALPPPPRSRKPRAGPRSALRKGDGCRQGRRRESETGVKPPAWGVPAPSSAPVLGGWRADDGRASSPVLGNTARAGEAGFSRRSLDREHRHGANSGVRGSPPPLFAPPERRGPAAASGKAEKTAPLYGESGDMAGGRPVAFTGSGLQSAPSGAARRGLCASSRSARRGDAGRNVP